MAAITIGTTGTIWGVTAETGVILQKFDRKVNRKIKEIANETGETSLVSMYNPIADYTFSSFQSLSGTTGVALVAPGVVQTYSNTTSGAGVTTGGIYTMEVTYAQTNEDFKQINWTGKQWPLIA